MRRLTNAMIATCGALVVASLLHSGYALAQYLTTPPADLHLDHCDEEVGRAIVMQDIDIYTARLAAFRNTVARRFGQEQR